MDFNKENLPKHIAIIMDGNRRWAKQRGKIASFGHKEGEKTLEKIVRYAKTVGVKNITVYAFSTENWKRSEEEVSWLMTLLRNYLDDYTKRADTENIKIGVAGDMEPLNEGLRKSIANAIEMTKNNTAINFNICLNYGGRDELVKATQKIASKVKNGELAVEDITEEVVTQNMYIPDMPEPDLMIRTSGEIRTSGFLMWQLAYTEFLFLDKFWPDFTEKDLDDAIEVYKNRKRNFGAN